MGEILVFLCLWFVFSLFASLFFGYWISISKSPYEDENESGHHSYTNRMYSPRHRMHPYHHYEDEFTLP